MKNKDAFTLSELIVVIVILSLVIILVAPNIIGVSEKSKLSIKDVKIKTIITAAENYGNKYINRFQNCKNETDPEILKQECTLTVDKLIKTGYLSSENDDKTIVDPKTNQVLDGNILICYDPANINVYASYLEDDSNYSCRDIDIETGNSLSLSATSGIGYVGGKDIKVQIRKIGNFENNFTCTSSNNNLAECIINDSKSFTIKIVAPDFVDDSKKVKIKVTGRHENGTLEKEYNLTILPTSIEIDLDEEDLNNNCMPSESIEEYGIIGNNLGKMTVTSSDEDILSGVAQNRNLQIFSKNKTGLATLTITETNGNKSVDIKKRVYNLKLLDKMPEGMLLGKETTFRLDYGGNDSVTIMSSNPNVLSLKTDEEIYTNEVILEDGDSFTVKAEGTGSAELRITGNPCGTDSFEINVSNLSITDKNATLYQGGKSFKTEVNSYTGDTFTCESENAKMADCSINGNTLTIAPGTIPTDENGIDITVHGSKGGYDTVRVIVLETSLEIHDQNSEVLSKVCENVMNIESPNFNPRIVGTNKGKVSITNSTTNYLTMGEIVNDELFIEKRFLSSLEGLDSKYKEGYNTGISNIQIRENNGNKTANLDYYIYSLNLDKKDVTLTATEEKTIIANSSTTGKLSVIVENENIAKVTIENPDTYDYEINSQNESIITIKGVSLGRTTVLVRGEDCGEIRFSINVLKTDYYVDVINGTYTDHLEDDTGNTVTRMTCSTEGSNDSCQIKLPNIIPHQGFVENGYSRIKDDSKEFSVGDVITVNAYNNGEKYYGNSIDNTQPICKIENEKSNFKLNKKETISIVCTEEASGIEDPVLETSDFLIEDYDEDPENNIAYIDSISSPKEIRNSNGKTIGYGYNIELVATKIGSFEFILKQGALVDKFENKNEKTTLATGFTSEYNISQYWSIGKEQPKDVVAILYDNKDIENEGTVEETDSEEKRYTLILYGEGEMKDFDTEENLPPWYNFGASIEKIKINEDITNVGKYAFWWLEVLNEVSLPNGLKIIDENAFSLSNITNITIPSTVESIENSAFYGCENLSEITLNEGLKEIKESAFTNTSISSLVIPSSVLTIGANAFKSEFEEFGLHELTFASNSNLTRIGSSAFSNHHLKDLILPASLETIESNAFALDDYQSSELESLTFEENSNLKTIEMQAFYNVGMSTLELPDSVTSIYSGAFYGTRVTKFTVGTNLSNLQSDFINGENLKEFEVDSGNENYVSIDGILYNKDVTSLIKYPPMYYRSNNELTIPSTVENLNYSSFEGWESYEIEDVNFILNIPATTTNLNAEYNFNNFVCSEILVDADNENYKSVDGVLYNKDLTKIYILPKNYNSTSYEIPNGVTSVENGFAYLNTKVQEIIVPESVTYLGLYAFVSNFEFGLKKIYFNPNDEVDNTVSFDVRNFDETLEQRLEVYVKTEDIKMSLEDNYSYLEDKIIFIQN